MSRKQSRNGNRSPGWARILSAAVIPFCFALLLGLAIFRKNASTSTSNFDQQSRSLSSRKALGCSGDECGTVLRVPKKIDSGENLEPLFMFVGILSGRGYRHRRMAVRDAWSNNAQIPGIVVSKYILSEDERTPQVEKELEEFGDVIFINQRTNYKSILYKTFFILQYAVQHYDVKFILKTDDDAFINIPPMIAQLTALCENENCERERIYMGLMAKNSEVLLQSGHKWNNAVFYKHTGLTTYPNYMMGGGYIISGEVSKALVEMHQRMPLKFTPIEDANVGFWLMAMEMRHINHPKMYTWAAPCCFKQPRKNKKFSVHYELDEKFENDICGSDPWLILHKIDSPTKMRWVGKRVANCTNEPSGYAESIKEYYPKEVIEDHQPAQLLSTDSGVELQKPLEISEIVDTM